MKILELVRYQNDKVQAKHPIWEKKRFKKNVFFVFLIYKHVKMQKKKKITCNGETGHCQKTFILSVFELHKYQNAKIHAKNPRCSNGTTLPENCHMGCFGVYYR